MTIHEFGEKNKDVLVMFHPLGVRWDIFEYVIPELSKHLHVIIPAIPGHDPDVPLSVAINEAVELAKRFGGESSGSFVNALLGRLAKNHE